MDISPDLLKRYLNNQCTPEERKRVEAHLELEKNQPSDLPDELAQGMKADFWKNISLMIGELQPTHVIPLHKRVMRYAAAAIILFTVGFFSYRLLLDNFGTDGTGQSIALKTIETQRGEKRIVTLSDGSTIRMNYETQIKVPKKFEGDQRIVHLTGHAHFDVARDTERPFIIYTADSKTQVLGTSFDINTKGKDETEIIVTSGNVIFSEKANEHNLVTLALNDRAVLNANKSIVTSEVNADRLTAWRDHRLVFDDIPLQEIIQVLEPWYDIEIRVEDKLLLEERFTYVYENPSLEMLMDRMSRMAGFEFQLEGKTVIIY